MIPKKHNDNRVNFIYHYLKLNKFPLINNFYEINNKFRLEDKKKASLSIEFLSNQIKGTSISEIKQALSRLVQIETQKLMLIESNEEYVFKVLDPPIVKEKKSSPNRAIIYMVGFLIGLFIGMIYALLNHFFKQ